MRRTLSSDQRSVGEEPDPIRRRSTRRKRVNAERALEDEVNIIPQQAPDKHLVHSISDAHVKEDGSFKTTGIITASETAKDTLAASGAQRRRITRRPGRKKQHIAADPQVHKQEQPGFKKARASHLRHRTKQNNVPLYAALDLGTNNCRLLIATPQKKGRFRVVDGFSRIVRLGEGLAQTGALSQAAMDRAVEALGVCASKLKNRDIHKQRLIATEACRQAANGTAFLERVSKETGLELEIVSREMEAKLAAEGCGSLIDKRAKGAVLFDIGGGSSELILVGSSQKKSQDVSDRISAWTSLPMGVVTLAERFGGRDISRELFEEMENNVLEEIGKFEGRHALADIFSKDKVHLLGTSGTVTTLAGIHLELPKYDRRQVDGLWLNFKQVKAVINRLLDMSYEQRMQNPCIGQERADLVLAGCAILSAIHKTWPTNRLRVADRGLREGLLSEMMCDDAFWKNNRTGNPKWRRGAKNKKKRSEDSS